MAKLVLLMGVTHDPVLPPRFAGPSPHPGVIAVKDRFLEMRRRLLESRPDAAVVIGSDHLNYWFTDNMPAFMVGKSPRARGPLPSEQQNFGLDPYEAACDVVLAKAIIEGGLAAGVDFAFSDEFLMDHAFVMPLSLLIPERNLPIVPIFSNVVAPPVPPASRFYAVGELLRSVIEKTPGDKRIAVIATGHLAFEMGGPHTSDPATLDPEFDRAAVELMAQADLDGLFALTAWERMTQAGNFTTSFLNFILLLGIAGCAKPSVAEAVSSDTNPAPFFLWDSP